MATRPKPKENTTNGTPPEMETKSIELAAPEAQLIYTFLRQGAFPSVFEKRVASVLQEKLEAQFGPPEEV